MKSQLEHERNELVIVEKKLKDAENTIVNNRKKNNEELQLKQFRIREMECELNKRETELLKYLQTQQQYEDDKGKLYSENKKLEAELEALRRDYEIIEKEAQSIKSDNDLLKNKLKNVNNILENVTDKENLLIFYKEKVNKCDEIIKLQELNLTVSLL